MSSPGLSAGEKASAVSGLPDRSRCDNCDRDVRDTASVSAQALGRMLHPNNASSCRPVSRERSARNLQSCATSRGTYTHKGILDIGSIQHEGKVHQKISVSAYIHRNRKNGTQLAVPIVSGLCQPDGKGGRLLAEAEVPYED